MQTVQATLESALGRVADHPIRATTAGRTDSGVHASGQVVHFDTTADRREFAWLRGANANLPESVAVTWVKEVGDDFHARFSACLRAYRYVILSRSVRPTYLARKVTWTHESLDESRMVAAAEHLVGRHDFSAYRSVHCQSKQPIREVHKLNVGRRGAWIWFDIHADGFLHHMVRNIAGVLIAIGSGARAVDWSREVLVSRDRRCGGVTAPPDGLYLSEVHYPSRFRMPEPPAPCRYW